MITKAKCKAKRPVRLQKAATVACFQPDSDQMLDIGSIQLGDRQMKSHLTPVVLATAKSKTRKSTIDDVKVFHRHHAALLTQTLQLLYASEVLIFAEYSEAACAFMYSMYSLAMYHLPNSKYVLPFLGFMKQQFWGSITNSAIYTFLELVTMCSLFGLIRNKFGFSSYYQLAFVLEKYWMSVQGKIAGSFTLIVIFNTVHQGTDLSLSFNWEQVLKGSQQLTS